MAHKKKGSAKRSKSSGRRRRVSGPASDVVMQVALGIGGAIVARLAVNMVNKSLVKARKKELLPEIAGLMSAGVGLFLLPMVSKDPMVKSIGFGMGIAGGYTAV